VKKKTNKAKNPKRKMLIGLCIALSVILVLLIAGTAYLESVLGLIGRDLNNDTMSPEEYEEFLQNQQSDGDFTGPVLDPSAPVIEPMFKISPLFCFLICFNTACAK